MSLIENLKLNFEAVSQSAPRAPQNLRELRSLLRSACLSRSLHSDLSYYCGWYADYLGTIHREENQAMCRTRGKARRMWAEQSLIYTDLIGLLQDLEQDLSSMPWARVEESTDTLYELVDELQEAAQEMVDWSSDEEPRCLKCGWNGSSGHCPHCQVRVLKPVRSYATQINSYVELGPLQTQLFHTLLQVLEGERDLTVLRAPLQRLQDSYQQSLGELEAVQQLELARHGLTNLHDALAGITQMARAFEDGDAQHLEDGWSMIFQADRANLAAVEQTFSGSAALAAAHHIIRDQISLSNE